MKIQKWSMQYFIDTLSEVLERFPVAYVAIFSATITSLYLIGNLIELPEMATLRIYIFFIFATLFGIAASLYVEGIKGSKSRKQKKYVIAQVLVFVLALGHAMSLPDLGNGPSFDFLATEILLGVLSALLIFSAPFLQRLFREKKTNLHFLSYSVSTLAGIVEGAFISVVIFLLGASIFGTLEFLFDLGLSGELYARWAVLSFMFVAPLYVLAKIPVQFDRELEIKNDSLEKFVRFVTYFIALPFIGMYTLIIYIYTLGVLFTLPAWPESFVTWMVIWFSVFGYLFFVISYYIKDQKIIATFRKVWPLLVLPQLALLFYAIIGVIGAYGLTINRYLVLLFGFWILGNCLYYVFSQSKQLLVLPVSLGLVIVLVLLGPWNIYKLPAASQLERLESMLVEAEILVDGEIRTLEQEEVGQLSQNLRKSIPDVIRYICDSHGCEHMQRLFGLAYYPESGTDDYRKANTLIDATGLPYYYYGGDFVDDERSEMFSYYSEWSQGVTEIDQYSKVINARTFYNYEREIVDANVTMSGGVITIRSDLGNETFDLSNELGNFLRENGYGIRQFEREVVDTQRFFTTPEGHLVIPTQISGYVKDGTVNLENVSLIMFVR